MPGSGRSWHVGGATCQDRDEGGMLEAQHARITAKLASWRRNLQGSGRSWQVGGGTCQDRSVVVMGSKKSQECNDDPATFHTSGCSAVRRSRWQVRASNGSIAVRIAETSS